MRRAVFPGSFDPITKGHEDVVRRATTMFDEVVVAVGRHSGKSSMFSVDMRLQMMEAAFADLPSVQVASYDGLTAQFCMEKGARFQVRGVRNAVDFEYEQMLAQMTREFQPGLETVVLFTSPSVSFIHATAVRDLLRHGGDVSAFVSDPVLSILKAHDAE